MFKPFFYFFILVSFLANAQKKCITTELNTVFLKQNILKQNTVVDDSILVIPVVVHVVYNKGIQNVSDTEIENQIERLNLDFSNLNQDSLQSTHPFYTFKGNSNIRFCLAKLDDKNNPTNGITRTYTDVTSFSLTSNNLRFIHQSSKGGKDNWDPTKYFNIWIANLGDGVFGFSSTPEQANLNPIYDGVVIHYSYFGNELSNNKGRTLVHEVGHYLGLKHLWGDDFCGNDNINDTPPQEKSNSGCPNFPRNFNNYCGSDGNGEMYMNFMDYTDDNCTVMFTKGQISKMRESIVNYRLGLLENKICEYASSNATLNNNLNLEIYPNPASDWLHVKGLNTNSSLSISIYSINGNLMYNETIVGTTEINMNINFLQNGLYFVRINHQTFSTVSKIIVQ